MHFAGLVRRTMLKRNGWLELWPNIWTLGNLAGGDYGEVKPNRKTLA